MPDCDRSLTIAHAYAHLEASCLRPSIGPSRVGLEAEWHTIRPGRASAVVPLADVRDALAGATPPAGSTITFEPGAQVELSTRPAGGIAAAIDALSADAGYVTAALRSAGIAMVGVGVDPCRAPLRQLDAPRYRAMETYFDADGPAGRVMMSRTAALQVNVDNGPAAEMDHRWRTAHAIGPAMVAAFANSPRTGGRSTGWRSSRMATWLAMDPTRTRPVGDRDPFEAWIDAVLDARVMLVRTKGDDWHVPQERFTFRRWIEQGHPLGHPTVDDLEYHLTTLFPPVRAKGWLELRYLDALPDEWWPVAAAVTAVLVDDHAAAAVARAVCLPTLGRWRDAARVGLADDELLAAARRCFVVAAEALERRAPDWLLERIELFVRRYLDQRRCPGDDVLTAGIVRMAVDERSPAWI